MPNRKDPNVDRRTLKLSYENKADLQSEICERIAADESLTSICRSGHMPTMETVYNWVFADPSFGERFQFARLMQAHAAADQLTDIRKALEEGAIDASTATAAANLLKWEAARRLSRPMSAKFPATTRGPEGPQYDFDRLTLEDRAQLESLLIKCSVAPRAESERRA